MSTLAAAAANYTFADWYADKRPDATAIVAASSVRTWRQLADEISALSQAFRAAGLQAGDSLAILLPNGPEFPAVFLAGMQIGLRVTPVNWHLAEEEVAHIVQDCEAKALIVHARFADNVVNAARSSFLKAKISLGGAVEGFEDYATVIAQYPYRTIDDPVPGTTMLYTSGTTGKPKGVKREKPEAHNPDLFRARFDFQTGDKSLLCGPIYHAAPLSYSVILPLFCGNTVVMLDRFDAELVLSAIATYKITHTHLVPAMFERLLALPDEKRKAADINSIKLIIHGAAPCPIKTKYAMIEWFGPVLLEYYGATEGNAGNQITSEEWIKKPGSVGKPSNPEALRILDEQGNIAPTGTAGRVYIMTSPTNPFEYFKAADKTRDAYRDGFFWLGDIGYIDEDGYLFLTGRTAECIISGGVNIYPNEVDNVLLGHDAVHDVCTVGIPDDSTAKNMGELVHSVVALNDGYVPGEGLVQDLIAFAQARLGKFKCPKSIDFVGDIPRSPAGKTLRSKVREPYWAGREKSI